jgi:hypothetical protein
MSQVKLRSELSAQSAAELANVKRSRIYGWMRLKSGLPVRREKRRIYITVADLFRFMESRGIATPLDRRIARERQLKVQAPVVGFRSGRTLKAEESCNETFGSGQRELRPRETKSFGQAYISVLEWIV